MLSKRTVTLSSLILEPLPFLHFYTSNCVRNIPLKSQEVSTRNFEGRQILLSTCVLQKKHNPAITNFGVIIHCSFLHCDFCPRHNSETTWDINKRQIRCVQNLFRDHQSSPGSTGSFLYFQCVNLHPFDPLPPLNLRKKLKRYIAGAQKLKCYKSISKRFFPLYES
jgi:hypothetical protein